MHKSTDQGQIVQLFLPGDAPSTAYCNLRDRDHCVEWKIFCEALWKRYEPYADPHFLNEIRIQFNPRFWEMYLAVVFLELGFELHKHRDSGPEFGIDIEGKRYWFDAIAPTGGTGPDAVPQEFDQREARIVPQEQIILRITSALAAKRAKWQKDMASGRVSENDGYVVAINVRSIDSAIYGGDMPYIVKALYGFGDLAVSIDQKTLKVIESKHMHRPTITKASGTKISTRPFEARECPEVSAVLHSIVDAANFPKQLGGDFMILHNDQPNIALPRGKLRFALEYWIENEYLCSRDWSKTN